MENKHLTMDPATILNWVIGLFIVGALATVSGFWLAFVPPGSVAKSAASFTFLLAGFIHMVSGVVLKIPTRDPSDPEAAAKLATWFSITITLMLVCFAGYFFVNFQA